MYINDKYAVTIRIELGEGVYIFNKKSATGKTRLAKELKEIQIYDKDVSSYTYNDKLLGISMESIFNGNKKVILLDRYDMYNGDGADLIDKYAKSCIILIDCKDSNGPRIDTDYELCFIDMSSDCIEVTA